MRRALGRLAIVLLVAVRACDPGEAAPLTPPTPRAFDVLSQRTEVIHVLMRKARVGFLTARCVTDRIITAFGPARFTELNEGRPSPAEQLSISQVIQGAYAVC